MFLKIHLCLRVELPPCVAGERGPQRAATLQKWPDGVFETEREKLRGDGSGRHVCARETLRDSHFSTRLPHERTARGRHVRQVRSRWLSLARARELCTDAKRATAERRSPAIEKQREKRRLLEAKSFGEFGEKWLTAAPMADSTRAMRRSIFERELLPVWRNGLLTEITPDDLRTHCGAIVDRGAPATAIHVRDSVKQIYGFAILHGEKASNPADDVGPASIATFVPKDRSLSPMAIRIMLKQLEKVATLATIRLGMRLYLQTMVCKSELQDATWDEVDFENAVWTIPKESRARIVT